MSYEQSFNAGERQAFEDRIAGIRQARPAHPQDPAWWDGYCPRNSVWWKPQPLMRRDHFDPAPSMSPPTESATSPRHLRSMTPPEQRQRLNPPDDPAVRRLLIAQREAA